MTVLEAIPDGEMEIPPVDEESKQKDRSTHAVHLVARGISRNRSLH